MANSVSDTYNEWREAEQALFQAYPVLKVGKALTQALALPAMTASAATYIPLAGPVVGTAIHQGTDFMQNHLHAFNEHRIGERFAELRSNIPEGWGHGVKVHAFDGWAKLRTADLLAKNDVVTRLASGYVAPSVIGKAILDTAPRVANFVTQLPGGGVIGFALAQSQAVLQKTQDFLTVTRQHVRAVGLDVETFIEQGFNQVANKQDQNQNQGQSVSEGKGEKVTPDEVKAPETVLNDSPTKIEPPSLEQTPPQAPEQSPFIPVPVDTIPGATEQPVQQPDRAASDYFQKLASEFGGKNLNTEKMKIFFDNKEVFRLSDGQPDPNHTNVTNDQMQAFKDALADPANFKGTLEIRQGAKILLSIRDGQVYDPMNKIQELLNVKLTEGPANIPQTTSEGFYQRYSEGVKGLGLKGTSEIAEKALKAGHDQGEILNMLKENDPTIKRTIEQRGPEAGLKEAQLAVDGASRKMMMDNAPKQGQGQEQKQEQKQEHSQAPGL